MPFSAGEIAGFIGAAAWLPQIISWWIKYRTIPTVIVIPDRMLEIGYTTFGPILNIRLAVSTEKKDVLLNNFEITMTHEKGEQHIFTWQGTTENLSRIKDQSGTSQIIEKDENGIALKIKTDVLVDRNFKFQVNKFHDDLKPILDDAVEHQNYLKQKNDDYQDELFKSKEVLGVIQYFKTHNLWKEGTYKLKFKADCVNGKMNFEQSLFGFKLTQQDVLKLAKNIDLFDDTFECSIKNGMEGFTKKEPLFYWVNPFINKL